MKVVLIVALVCLAVAAQAKPVRQEDPSNIDWKGAKNQVKMLKNTIKTNMDTIKEAAILEDPVIGKRIKKNLKATSEQAIDVLEQLQDSCEAKTLRLAESIAAFDQILGLLSETGGNVKPDVDQLSVQLQEYAELLFQATVEHAQSVASEFHRVLSVLEPEPEPEPVPEPEPEPEQP